MKPLGTLFLFFALCWIVPGGSSAAGTRPFPTLDPGRVEVAQFMSFDCDHCEKMQPFMAQLAAKLPKEAYVRQVHVVWTGSRDPKTSYARLMALLDLAGRPRGGVEAMYKLARQYTADLRPMVENPREMEKWLKSQTIFDARGVLAAMGSPRVDALVADYDRTTRTAGVFATPLIVVDGRHEIPLTGNPARDWDAVMGTVWRILESRKGANAGGNRPGAPLPARPRR